MLSHLYYLLFASLLSLSPAHAILSRPMSQQFPPVARINHPYLWTLSPNTFTPAASTYNASGLPSWLHFESSSGTFSGTPLSTDAGGFTVSVTAPDGTEDSVYLTTSSLPGANLTDPVIDQLNSSSITSAFPYPSASSPCYPGFRVPPGWSFSLGFQWYTFTASSHIYYSASMSDGSPLPPWLNFNADTVTFDGVTPWPEEELEGFSIVLGGSDVKGFTDVSQSFNICVSAHAFEPAGVQSSGSNTSVISSVVVNVTAGEEISTGAGGNGSFWSSVWTGFTLDGSTLRSSDVSNVSIDTSSTSWLTYNPTNITLSGSPPDKAVGSNISVPIVVTDKYGDAVNSTMNLVVFPSTFISATVSAKLTPGGFLDLPLGQFFSNATAGGSNPLNFTAAPRDSISTLAVDGSDNGTTDASTSSCLTFNPGNHSLTGWVPSNGTTTTAFTLIAQDLVTHAWSRSVLTLSTSATVVSTEGATTAHHGLSAGAKAAIGVVVGCVVGLALLCLLLTCCRRYVAQEKHKVAEQGGIEEKAWMDLVNRESEEAAARDVKVSGSPASVAKPHLFKMGEFGVGFGSPKKGGGAGMAGEVYHVHGDAVVGRVELGLGHPPALQARGVGGGSVRGMTDSIAARTKRWLVAAATGVGSVGRRAGQSFATAPIEAVQKRDISNPVIKRSLSNAAYQAQLALTINAAEIAARGGATYTYAPASGREGKDDASSLGPGHTGDTSESNESTPHTGRAGVRAAGGVGTEEGSEGSDKSSRFGAGKSSRASWESEIPFSWTNADRSRGDQPGDGASEGSASRSGSSAGSHGEHEAESNNHSNQGHDVPVQRSDFRPVPPHALPRPPSAFEDGEISIDNIHFPSDYDDDDDDEDEDDEDGEDGEEEDAVVIATASRVSPGSNASGHGVAGRGDRQSSGGSGSGSGSSAAQAQAHSRLVSFGKQRKVVVTPPDGSTSQTGVVGSTSATTNGSPGSRLALTTTTTTTTGAGVGGSHRVLLGVAEHFHFFPPLFPDAEARLASQARTRGKSGGGVPVLAAYMERRVGGVGGAGGEVRKEELPEWLHFDDGELWGVPPETERGTLEVIVMEKKSGEKVVGRFTIEVVGRK